VKGSGLKISGDQVVGLGKKKQLTQNRVIKRINCNCYLRRLKGGKTNKRGEKATGRQTERTIQDGTKKLFQMINLIQWE